MYIGEIIMKKNIQHTTKVGKILSIILFQINHRTRNSLIQRTILSEGYATDSIFSTFTCFEGYNAAQTFTEIKSKYQNIYGTESESGGPDILLDFFCK